MGGVGGGRCGNLTVNEQRDHRPQPGGTGGVSDTEPYHGEERVDGTTHEGECDMDRHEKDGREENPPEGSPDAVDAVTEERRQACRDGVWEGYVVWREVWREVWGRGVGVRLVISRRGEGHQH